MSERPPRAEPFEPWGDIDAGVIDLQERLGLGGMGEVRKGWDHRGNRVVALKLLRAEGPDALRRFVHEAKALASCDHPAICRVYGLVSLEGRPCIVMEYVQGGSLQEAYPSLSVTERVRVIKTVAEALGHAHAKGLVHFDVKPSNVLVEQRNDGSLRPLLTDFGSARERDRTLHTMTATAVVTPEYMAPELLGALGRSDARADVYGLGATLYHVLADRPPFRGSTAEVLRALARAEPDPIRSVAPRVHPDLARIVEAAMRKDPVLRYASAAAVAADLGRFLDGQAVLAPRPGMLARVASRARRNRAVTGVVVAIMIALVATAVFALSLRARREREAREAESYLHDVEQLEGTLRQGAFRPLHNLDEERGVVAKRLGELEVALPKLKGRAAIIVQYALGRGYLGLGDHEKARAHLQYAWDHGEHSADLALALGRALGESYRDGLDEAERISDAKERAARRTALAQELRTPALRLLHQGADAVLDAPELLEAQIAFYEGRHDDAMRLAERARARVPGLFEAKRLEGDVELHESVSGREHGDYHLALASLSAAGDAYDEALRDAPSDLGALYGSCARWEQSLSAAYDQSRLEEDTFVPAIAVCDRARTAAPRDARVLRSSAEVLGIRARYEGEHGREARSDYERALSFFRLVVSADARPSPDVVAALGDREWRFASYLARTGDDPSAAYDEAVATLDDGSEAPRVALALAQALSERALWSSRIRVVDEGEMARARDLAKRVAVAEPDGWSAHNRLAGALAYWGRIATERGETGTARAMFAAADDEYRAVQRLTPEADYGFFNACEAHAGRAQLELDVGGDARGVLDMAKAACATGVRIDPNYAPTHAHLAAIDALAAEEALVRGVEVSESVAEGMRRADEATAIDPGDQEAAMARALLSLAAARGDAAAGRDPTRRFSEVATFIDGGRSFAPKNSWQWELTLRLDVARAGWATAHGKAAAPVVDEGLEAARRELALRPRSPRILAWEGALELLSARASTDPAARTERARSAAEHLAAAIGMNPNLARAAQPLLDEARKIL